MAATRRLVKRVTCPHCWRRFAPEQVLWISRHAELMGDQVAGPEAASRFLPTRFSIDGHALDARGTPCHAVACPSCHLPVPRDLLEFEPLFISIIGVPFSGKSYYLTAMTWELRTLMPAKLALTFSDTDTVFNRSLNTNEETLFLGNDRNDIVAIRKTELQGELYDNISLGQQKVSLPRPFLFTLRPTQRHPNAKVPNVSRVICLYDNAGEHFQPGMDTPAAPVTHHLAKAPVLMFLYDPTQDMRFRKSCAAFSRDPQLDGSRPPQRQETILREAALRVRTYTGTAATQKLDRVLLVLVGKSDYWGPLLPGVDIVTEPVISLADGTAAVDVPRIEAVSNAIKKLMNEQAPEFVAAAEAFCQQVVYIPVSALGQPPAQDATSGFIGIRPNDIKPRWVTVPILYTLAKWAGGTVRAVKPKT